MTTDNSMKIRLHFSGHETFPLRHAWISKALPAVAENPSILHKPERLMVKMGIGKNMARSVRHWLEVLKLVAPGEDKTHNVSNIGNSIFLKGKDLYLEHVSTIWILHYILACNEERASSWYYLFNKYPNATFSKSRLQESINNWCDSLHFQRPSANTLKRDIMALIGMYSSAMNVKDKDQQAILACPMRELNLFSSYTEDGDQIWKFRQLSYGEISDDVFAYCLALFLESEGNPPTYSFADLLENDRSPARVFRFSENLLAKYLTKFGLRTDQPYIYNTTAGTKQILRSAKKELNSNVILERMYTEAYAQ